VPIIPVCRHLAAIENVMMSSPLQSLVLGSSAALAKRGPVSDIGSL
jgi:hypothetical protein